jgi:hypothetical protein
MDSVFGGTRFSPYGEGRRGINIYNANNISVTASQFCDLRGYSTTCRGRGSIG